MSARPENGHAATLERQLDDFDPAARRRALEELAALARDKLVLLKPPGRLTNLHCHSFYSFNGYGFSPSRIAWLARREGWESVGVVDFDTLDGLEETLAAGRLLGTRAVVGIETRVFIPEYADRAINSPGEPGIFYLMGAGFPRAPGPDSESGRALRRLHDLSDSRNREIVRRVNDFLPGLNLDYEREVLPLTPAGNATERHIVRALDDKIRAARAGDAAGLAGWWARALGLAAPEIAGRSADAPMFQDFLRAKLMKQGAPGYIAPDPASFPTLAEGVAMIRAAGGLPVATWLDGTSAGEKDAARFLDFMLDQGILALNIIPDRNWNLADPAERELKTRNLRAVAEAARAAGLPMIAGTEMNKPGQKLVDGFDAPALAPLLGDFRAGAFFIYGQTIAARRLNRGWSSAWAEKYLPERATRTRFYTRLGETLPPARLNDIEAGKTRPPAEAAPEEILAWAEKHAV